MKSLATLIKLQKTCVDEQRTHLAQLQTRLDEIDGKIAEMEARQLREQEIARQSEVRVNYGAFVKAMIAQTRALEKERHMAALAVKIAQEKLSELFEEQKRYEIAEEQRREKEAQEERRRETIELDEIGSTRHQRQKSD